MKDINELMELVDEYTPCEGKLAIHRFMHDGHEDEWSANYLISKMMPVAWLGVDGEPSDMHEYLTMLGVTPKSAKAMVQCAYDKARLKGGEINVPAPKLDANEWDCYWALAMMIADYWITHWGDLEVASMLAYQYLSDPDR